MYAGFCTHMNCLHILIASCHAILMPLPLSVCTRFCVKDIHNLTQSPHVATRFTFSFYKIMASICCYFIFMTSYSELNHKYIAKWLATYSSCLLFKILKHFLNTLRLEIFSSVLILATLPPVLQYAFWNTEARFVHNTPYVFQSRLHTSFCTLLTVLTYTLLFL